MEKRQGTTIEKIEGFKSLFINPSSLILTILVNFPLYSTIYNRLKYRNILMFTRKYNEQAHTKS